MGRASRPHSFCEFNYLGIGLREVHFHFSRQQQVGKGIEDTLPTTHLMAFSTLAHWMVKILPARIARENSPDSRYSPIGMSSESKAEPRAQGNRRKVKVE
ncbi:hypothetical protein SUGI_0472340 [Cryptomeria japonica]|nr:hypothetical protein SUGI_0472340 [Cryptomeria japonica]